MGTKSSKGTKCRDGWRAGDRPRGASGRPCAPKGAKTHLRVLRQEPGADETSALGSRRQPRWRQPAARFGQQTFDIPTAGHQASARNASLSAALTAAEEAWSTKAWFFRMRWCKIFGNFVAALEKRDKTLVVRNLRRLRVEQVLSCAKLSAQAPAEECPFGMRTKGPKGQKWRLARRERHAMRALRLRRAAAPRRPSKGGRKRATGKK